MKHAEVEWSGMLLVCANERDALTGRDFCGHDAGRDLRRWLRDRARSEGLKGELLVSTVRCLGICPRVGTAVAALPDPASGRARQLLVVESDEEREQAWRELKVCLMGSDA